MGKRKDNPLFAAAAQAKINANAPLAVRMRPRPLDEFFGQEHFIGPGKLLRRMLDADRLTSLIFYGPPGIGRTVWSFVLIISASKSAAISVPFLFQCESSRI